NSGSSSSSAASRTGGETSSEVDETTTGSTAGTKPDTSNPSTLAKCPEANDIPEDTAGMWMDPTSWFDMTGMNCTFTNETIGKLPLSGLNSSWDDSARANPNVPPLDKPWGSYEQRPVRGVNLGGWLSLEPFITPSLFDYDD